MTTTNSHTDERALRRAQARSLSWERLGRCVTFYLPGMFHLEGETGRYPAVSITGNDCALDCDHCGGKILSSMRDVREPAALLDHCLRLEERGQLGVLLSGGCDPRGGLPWEDFLPVIAEIKARTRLIISAHCGLVDEETARRLRDAGVDQALLDVIGDDETYRSVCHVDFGVERIDAAMSALHRAGLPMVPHVVCGMDHGRMRGERKALEMIAPYSPSHLVIVSLLPMSGTGCQGVTPPDPEEVADIIARARLLMPDTCVSLGCVRQRGETRLDVLALEAGANRIALPSEEAVSYARSQGLDITFQKTCCSVTADLTAGSWRECDTRHEAGKLAKAI